jgi:hypothetical protein
MATDVVRSEGAGHDGGGSSSSDVELEWKINLVTQWQK